MARSLLLFAAITCNSLHSTQAFHPPSSSIGTSSLQMSKRQQSQHHPLSTPIPAPPPISMPVWSFSCPTPNSPSSSMSIVTFATAVSVSFPKLWAVSLYKTSRTRCAFLGVEKSGEEYNDVAFTSSSVLTGSGLRNAVRRKEGMRGEGMLAAEEGAVGWRARRLSQRGDCVSRGMGVLQLMTPSQAGLVPILGKRTGWDASYCKKTECAKEMALKDGWISNSGSNNTPNDVTFEVLPNCASYIQLKLKQVTDGGGDHDVAICEVFGTGVWDDENNNIKWLSENETGNQIALDSTSVLYTGLLREEGII